jgi:hypothetical protein
LGNLPSLGKAKVEVRADLSKYKRDLKSAEKQTNKATKLISNSFKTMGAAIVAIGLKNIIADTIGAFGEQEKAIRSVQVAIEQQGGAWSELGTGVLKLASDLQGKTVFGDEATLAAMAKAINTGADYKKVVESTGIAQDIAAATGRDLGTIFELIGRAIQGQSEQLGRYVPAIKDLNNEQRDWVNVQKILNKQFAGQAAKLATTQTSRIIQMKNAWGDLKEVVGELILKIGSPAVGGLLGAINAVNKSMSAASDGAVSASDKIKKAQEKWLSFYQAKLITVEAAQKKLFEEQDVLLRTSEIFGVFGEEKRVKALDVINSQLDEQEALWDSVNSQINHFTDALSGMGGEASVEKDMPVIAPLAGKVGQVGAGFEISPESVDVFVDKSIQSFDRLKAKLTEFQQGQKDTFFQFVGNPMNQMFDDLISGTLKLDMAFQSLMKSMIQEIGKFLARQATMQFFKLFLKFTGFAINPVVGAAALGAGELGDELDIGGPSTASAPNGGSGQSIIMNINVGEDRLAQAVINSLDFEGRRSVGAF